PLIKYSAKPITAPYVFHNLFDKNMPLCISPEGRVVVDYFEKEDGSWDTDKLRGTYNFAVPEFREYLNERGWFCFNQRDENSLKHNEVTSRKSNLTTLIGAIEATKERDLDDALIRDLSKFTDYVDEIHIGKGIIAAELNNYVLKLSEFGNFINSHPDKHERGKPLRRELEGRIEINYDRWNNVYNSCEKWWSERNSKRVVEAVRDFCEDKIYCKNMSTLCEKEGYLKIGMGTKGAHHDYQQEFNISQMVEYLDTVFDVARAAIHAEYLHYEEMVKKENSDVKNKTHALLEEKRQEDESQVKAS
ncbi:hypothetical protein KY321_03580, partial [Candidatus Woesearchaeota archaeon]|nr:hypothetical protein [Candidatus Woesearchaeota archaeon]